MSSRFLIIVLGSYKNIEKDLNHIADSEEGVHYVDGGGIFMGTFYSPYSLNQIQDMLLTVPAFLLFDITDKSTNAVNLPSKYFKGLFPEYDETLSVLQNDLDIKLRKKTKTEEYDNVDDILDKLSRNKYDRNCLTKKEIDILEKK
jgi:hypothetical protein